VLLAVGSCHLRGPRGRGGERPFSNYESARSAAISRECGSEMTPEDFRRGKSAAAKTMKRNRERTVLLKGMGIALENMSHTCESRNPGWVHRGSEFESLAGHDLEVTRSCAAGSNCDLLALSSRISDSINRDSGANLSSDSLVNPPEARISHTRSIRSIRRL
jgi:hypothetical protein